MTAPDVDVVIAVHTPTRPIRRAVDSVLAASPGGRSRVIVVAHGMDADEIAPALEGVPAHRLVVSQWRDGIPSPAGPFNHGLEVAQAPFVAVMGSDDTLQPAALDTAVQRAERDDAEVVILPLCHAAGGRVEAPLVRLRRTQQLDAVRDRMFYRTAPLAIIRREVADRFAPVFDPAYGSGEDLDFGARLWCTARTSYSRRDPGYVIGDDAADRVTGLARPLEKVLAPVGALADRPWVVRASAPVRRALAIKMIRVHLLGAIASRASDPRGLRDGEVAVAATTLEGWLARAPGAAAVFSRAERGVIAAVASRDAAAIHSAAQRRHAARGLAVVMPRNPLRMLDRESAARRLLQYRLYRWMDRKGGESMP